MHRSVKMSQEYTNLGTSTNNHYNSINLTIKKNIFVHHVYVVKCITYVFKKKSKQTHYIITE